MNNTTINQLVINNISKLYNGKIVVNNVTFSIQKGNILGLLGHNGAGKTTIMKIITGYIIPDSGNVYVNDKQRVDKNMIGYLPERNPLYDNLYVIEYLSIFCKIYDLPESQRNDRLDYVINFTQIHDVLKKQIKSLSKGYRQRVGLSRALLHDPQILILDEPTSGLDPNQIIHFRQKLKDIKQDKIIILSTHIIQEVLNTCDNIIILKQGNLIFNSQINDLAFDKIEAFFN